MIGPAIFTNNDADLAIRLGKRHLSAFLLGDFSVNVLQLRVIAPESVHDLRWLDYTRQCWCVQMHFDSIFVDEMYIEEPTRPISAWLFDLDTVPQKVQYTHGAANKRAPLMNDP